MPRNDQTPLPRSKQLELRRNVLSMMRDRNANEKVMPGILPFISCPRAPRPILPDTPMPNVLPTYIETIGSFIALSEVVSSSTAAHHHRHHHHALSFVQSSLPTPPSPSSPPSFLRDFSFSTTAAAAAEGSSRQQRLVANDDEWRSVKYETAIHIGTVETEDNWMIYISPCGVPQRIHSVGHVLVKGI